MNYVEVFQAILMTPSLEGKLTPFDLASLQDDGKARDIVLETPARPRELLMRDRVAAKHGHLADPLQRARALHAFANHELLAIELMALAGLKFPSLRRAVARTIQEEQKHLRLYRARMEELGVGFGELPLNNFFWKRLSPMKSPVDYYVGMSLTFEQANLDFACHFAQMFREFGDETSAKIMDEVLADEIHHVEHGVKAFEILRPGKKDFWSEYAEALAFPMTPSRAKGTRFFEKPRLKAGLSKDFINQLKVFSQSKSRHPDVYLYLPEVEKSYLFDSPPWFHSDLDQSLWADFAPLMFLMCSSSDIVVVARKPSQDYLDGLYQVGSQIPEWVEISDPENLTSGLLGLSRPLGHFFRLVGTGVS